MSEVNEEIANDDQNKPELTNALHFEESSGGANAASVVDTMTADPDDATKDQAAILESESRSDTSRKSDNWRGTLTRMFKKKPEDVSTTDVAKKDDASISKTKSNSLGRIFGRAMSDTKKEKTEKISLQGDTADANSVDSERNTVLSKLLRWPFGKSERNEPKQSNGATASVKN